MISRNKVNLVEYGKIAKKCIFAAFNPTIAAAKNGEKWTLGKKLGKYYTCQKSCLNPHTPVAQKIADEVVFRRFQGERVEFFKSDLTAPPSDF